ncbi:MAG: hypothetical protein JGK35_00035 [Microcoleus sp. PH2017_16_JOR_D_A]|nr:hypothetical protein [Microcoleus sp. PH2017_16_JOR_D_A]
MLRPGTGNLPSEVTALELSKLGGIIGCCTELSRTDLASGSGTGIAIAPVPSAAESAFLGGSRGRN